MSPDAFARLKICQNAFAECGVPTRTPLGKLTALPRPSRWIWGPLGGEDRRGWKGVKGIGRKGRGREGKKAEEQEKGVRDPWNCIFMVAFYPSPPLPKAPSLGRDIARPPGGVLG